jgi:hypothetical protein
MAFVILAWTNQATVETGFDNTKTGSWVRLAGETAIIARGTSPGANGVTGYGD